MTKVTRKSVMIDLILLLAGVGVVVMILTLVGYLGHASAQSVVPSPTDPSASESRVLTLLLTGQYLPAVGAALVLIVGGLRSFLGSKISWFKTQIGGYVLAYGTSFVLYVATSLEQSAPITAKLLMMAFVAALTASGVLDHWRDITSAVKKVPPAVGVGATIAIALLGAMSCGSCGPTTQVVTHDIVVCAESSSADITALEAQCSAKIPDWSALEACVVAAVPSVGWKIGGCVIADLAQQFLVKKTAAQDVTQSNVAHAALEDYRAKYGRGSTFRTAAGDL